MIKTKEVIRTYYRNTSILYRLCSYNISTSSNITSSSNYNINTKVIYSHFKEEIALGIYINDTIVTININCKVAWIMMSINKKLSN